VSVILGDCLDVMAGMEPETFDAIVTDPPYGLAFMGKAWDHGAIGRPFADAMYRVAKPSAYLLAFGGTRTVHRMTAALEDAGWIIRDMLVWAYASGFPKSKASLKPAWEPIVMARKPGPLRMLAIDECRIGTTKDVPASGSSVSHDRTHGDWPARRPDVDTGFDPNLGRWPANVILTDPVFDGGIEGVVGGGETTTHPGRYVAPSQGNWFGPERESGFTVSDGDSGTYSRFFLIPKADRADREPVLGGPTSGARGYGGGKGVKTRECRQCGDRTQSDSRPFQPACMHGDWEWRDALPIARANVHPTVKPTDLMRHLVRLVTPTGGHVLDPFLGSGTTAIAAEMEGFAWTGIEREAEYVAIAEARLNGTQRGLGLETA
jgi:site-specific DNA-methyltransferase (adenine-specific)